MSNENEAKVASKSDIRAAIFSAENRKVKSEPVELFGQKLEMRQPTLAQINKLGQVKEGDKTPAIVKIMIEHVYVPGTGEKVFDIADAESLASMPAGPWLDEVNRAMEKLSGVNVKEAEKNSEVTD